MIMLGVNVDHVATIRQARGGREPDPVAAALAAEMAGADSITVHLREDRRHIQDRDVERLLEAGQTKCNLEMAASPEMVARALVLRPADCCLVPEKRAELTTEGGLDAAGQVESLTEVVAALTGAGIRVSLFIDPDPRQIEAALAVGAPVVELHTGRYAGERDGRGELHRLLDGAALAHTLGLQVNAGHGLNYHNVQPVAAIPGMQELNIGHAIIARAVFTGIGEAVREMKRLMREAARAGWDGLP
ncbi:MAG: pyridoxine 5'-phosphate synthase [Magnetococcales bacterium]|nr:pyridoxine 5'-phosphate synthase [Magnetococcales bacterium]